MVQGAGRPGQPNIGQRSIFGNGGPSFAQMPSFTPVTRGGQQPAAPQPAPAQPQAPAAPQASGHQPQGYAEPQYRAAPQAQQPRALQPQSPQPHAFGGGQQFDSQAYAAPTARQNPGANREIPDFGNIDSGFPDSIFGDLKVGAAADDHGAQMGDETYAEEGYAEDDASYAEGAGEMAYNGQYAHSGYDTGHAPAEAYQQDAYAGQQHMHPGDDPSLYGQQSVPYGHVPPADPSRQLQAFDSTYGQPPQIPLGDPTGGMHHGGQDYFEADRVDADFVDAGHAVPETGLKSKLMGTLKGRSTVMVASALLGAIALGGALAYAYKQSGGAIGSGDAPIVTADASPVKAAPDSPGGKEFPHKNKLIYDRLTNGTMPGSERLVPRQEDVAVPALPPATATAGLPAAVATTDPADPASAQAAGEDGGPRKVKTMVVRPDGSVEGPAADAAAQADSMMAQPNMMPVPAIQQPGTPQQMAAAAPAAAAAAAGSFVVQLGSSKSQTDALANFADAQQKYPSLLGNYQPLVRKTDLGPKGTWYRLQVGPLASKDAAYKLCGQLKAQGHGDCLVMAQ